MKLRSFLRTSLAAASVAVALLGGLPAAPVPINGAAATVNGVPVTQQEINMALAAQMGDLQRKFVGDELRQAMEGARVDSLRQLIDNQLILQAFKARGGSIPQREIDREVNRIITEHFNGDRQRFTDELSRAGRTMAGFSEGLRDQLIVREMRRAVLGMPDPPSPAAIEAAFRAHADEFRGESFIRYRQIFIPRESFEPGATPESQRALAHELHDRIEGGADFAELAKQYSRHASARQGGLAPVRSRTELVEWIQDPLFSTPVGQVTRVIDQPNGYYLFLVENIQLGELPPMAEVRDKLEDIVREESQKEEYEQWMGRLRADADIRILDSELAAAERPRGHGSFRPAAVEAEAAVVTPVR